MTIDNRFMSHAIELALKAERNGNPPIGAVITLAGEVVAEGAAAELFPKFDPTRHAEMEALRAVPEDLWESPSAMSLFTTLEPCLMCLASILIHGIGRIVFGASDDYGGAGHSKSHLPPYFDMRMAETQWLGPIMSIECDPLYERVLQQLQQAQRGLV